MGEVKVKASSWKPYEVMNETRDLSWLSDEPLDLGGTNNGPKPTELLLSSLASCMLITMRMYADRKGWEMGPTSVELKLIKGDDKPLVTKKIVFDSGLNEDQIARLTDISGRCPVAKMLAPALTFNSI